MRRRAQLRRQARRRPLVLALFTLALAAGVVLPSPPTAADPALRKRAAGDLAALVAAFQAYNVDTGRWPEAAPGEARQRVRRELVELGCLMADTQGLPGWSGPYLDLTLGAAGGSLVDPWGRPYLVFYLPGVPGLRQGSMRVYSAGPDRRLDSSLEDVAAGRVRGDDLTTLVTRRL